jgi:hypothetical protein
MAGQTTNYLFDYPTSTDYVKDGATAIETLADDVDATLFTALGGAYPGLRLVKKQTIGSAVSSVTVTSAFNETYDAYRVIVTGGVASTSNYLNIQLSGATSGYKYNLIYSDFGAAGIFLDTASNASFFNYAGSGTTQGLYMNAEVINPFLAKNTQFSAPAINASIGGNCLGIHPVATSYTGFAISTNGGTMTGGTIYVYGYGAS